MCPVASTEAKTHCKYPNIIILTARFRLRIQDDRAALLSWPHSASWPLGATFSRMTRQLTWLQSVSPRPSRCPPACPSCWKWWHWGGPQGPSEGAPSQRRASASDSSTIVSGTVVSPGNSRSLHTPTCWWTCLTRNWQSSRVFTTFSFTSLLSNWSTCWRPLKKYIIKHNYG